MLTLNNKKRPRIISLILCLFLLCLFSGCESETTTNGLKEKQITMTPKIEVTSSLPDSSDIPKETEDPKIENFSEMDEYFREFSDEVSYDESLDFDLREYRVHGVYDLNGDGELDTINSNLKANYEDGAYIEVNDIKVALGLCNPTGELQIIDLDCRDSYTEVAVFDDGPSGDPTFTFFRYDGKELYEVGLIDRYALMDGQGMFISWFHLANNFKPQFFSAWGEFKNNEYVITNHDVEQYIGNTYEVDGTGFFVPLDKIPENYFSYIVWDYESLREFDATKITLLDIYMDSYDRTLNWFYVELPDGERGLLYFWIGD